MDYSAIIDRHYPPGCQARGILIRHSRSVTRLALAISRRLELPLDDDDIRTAAMLHDIGICRCDAPSIGCHGPLPYLRHGLAGAELLRRDGAPSWLLRVARRHTGCGFTRQEARALGLPPRYVLEPVSLLERLICYADKFYSKSGDMRRKPLSRVRASMDRWGPATRARFEALHRQFR